MKTFTIGWLNKCRCGNKSHSVKTARGNESALWDDDAVKCNSCGRGGVIQVCEGQARVLWETDEEMAEGKPMSTITKERIANLLQFNSEGSNCQANAEQWEVHELARIALASLEAEPVASCIVEDGCMCIDGFGEYVGHSLPDGPHQLYSAPVVPVSVPDEDLLHMAASAIEDLLSNKNRSGAGVWADIPAKLRRAAMLQGAEPVSNRDELTDAVNGLLAVMDEYPESIVPINRDSAVVRQLRSVMHQGENGNYPDGWVACSERMPEPKRWLALYGARVFTHGDERGQPYHKSCVDQGYLGSDGQFYLLNWDQPGTLDDNYNNDLAIATHWMYWELPSAPRK